MTIKDKGYKDFQKRLQSLGKVVIEIGAHGQNNGISNHDIFVNAEIGNPSRGLVARAPVRKTIRDNHNLDNYRNIIVNLVRQTNCNVKQVANGLAETIRAGIVTTIMRGLEPELTEPYKTRKVKEGFTELPFIRTKNFVHSIVAKPRFK